MVEQVEQTTYGTVGIPEINCYPQSYQHITNVRKTGICKQTFDVLLAQSHHIPDHHIEDAKTYQKWSP